MSYLLDADNAHTSPHFSSLRTLFFLFENPGLEDSLRRCFQIRLQSARILFAVFFFVGLIVSSTSGDDATPAFVVSVEEEWQLEVGEPNLSANAPQVSMVMSPTDNLNDDYFMFLLNYRMQPTYLAGGMQIQHWSGEETEFVNDSFEESALTHVAEVVNWTQRLSIDSGIVSFQIKDGNSSSWPDFGDDDDNLNHSIYTDVSNLNAYTPAISLLESDIGYAGNRVVSLTLQRITWTLSDGTTHVLTAPIDIDSDLDPWN